jgi:hypothetical protein
MQTTNPVPMHVRRIVENTLHEQPQASRLILSRAIVDSTFCEPKQATEWVDTLRYASR